VVVLDDKHIVQAWNRWSENAWGLRAEEVVGVSFDSLDIGFPVYKLREQIISALAAPDRQEEQVLEGVDRRGRRILCRVRVAALTEGREAVGTVLAFEDITEERRKEDYARYLGRVIGRALNEIYFLDPESLRFILVNRGAEAKLGAPIQQLEQISLPELMPRTSLQALSAHLAPLMAGEQAEIVFETTLRSVSGQERPVEICMQHFPHETPPLLVAMVHDTSGRQAI